MKYLKIGKIGDLRYLGKIGNIQDIGKVKIIGDVQVGPTPESNSNLKCILVSGSKFDIQNL